jgi:uncharacterized membrane protein
MKIVITLIAHIVLTFLGAGLAYWLYTQLGFEITVVCLLGTIAAYTQNLTSKP